MRERHPTARRDSAIPILLYHSVADDPPPGQMRRFTVTPVAFREHVRAVLASGRTPVSISTLAAALRGAEPMPERAVAFTFDDGFEDTVAAVEHLRAAEVPGTVYVQTGILGSRAGLSLDGLRALVDADAEIGAHTVTHPRLDELPAARAADEARRSREVLQEHTGREIDTFAYPHGAHDRTVRAMVVELGFSSAAAVKNALSHPLDDPFAIARVTIEFGTSTDTVARLMLGEGAPLALRRERIRTRASRGIRRLRRRARPAGSPPAVEG